MAEVLRKKIRKVLGQATAICLSIDECKHRKIVRFRADLPTAYCAQPGSHWRVGASGFSQAGVLGLLDCSKKDLSDFEEDHAVTAVRKLEEFLTEFCTPRGRRRGSRKYSGWRATRLSKGISFRLCSAWLRMATATGGGYFFSRRATCSPTSSSSFATLPTPYALPPVRCTRTVCSEKSGTSYSTHGMRWSPIS